MEAWQTHPQRVRAVGTIVGLALLCALTLPCLASAQRPLRRGGPRARAVQQAMRAGMPKAARLALAAAARLPAQPGGSGDLSGGVAYPAAVTGGVTPPLDSRGVPRRAAANGARLPGRAPEQSRPSTPTSSVPSSQQSPSNVNISVRVFSPGDNGPLVQVNGATPIVSVASPRSSAGARAVLPATWIWNWNWGCGGRRAASRQSGGVWIWNWNWCSAAGGTIPMPQLPASLAGLSGLAGLPVGLPAARSAPAPNHARAAAARRRAAGPRTPLFARPADPARRPYMTFLRPSTGVNGPHAAAPARAVEPPVPIRWARPIFMAAGAGPGGGGTSSSAAVIGLLAITLMTPLILSWGYVRPVAWPARLRGGRLERPG